MKTFTSCDHFPSVGVWLVKRSHPKMPPINAELPTTGEEILLDGAKVVVERAVVYGDAECRFWPEIAIEVRPPCSSPPPPPK